MYAFHLLHPPFYRYPTCAVIMNTIKIFSLNTDWWCFRVGKWRGFIQLGLLVLGAHSNVSMIPYLVCLVAVSLSRTKMATRTIRSYSLPKIAVCTSTNGTRSKPSLFVVCMNTAPEPHSEVWQPHLHRSSYETRICICNIYRSKYTKGNSIRTTAQSDSNLSSCPFEGATHILKETLG
jgi:hypothetical protein